MFLFILGTFSINTVTTAITEGGALAILGWSVWYILSRYLPEERKEFLEERNKERQEYLESQKRMAKAISRLTNAIYSLRQK